MQCVAFLRGINVGGKTQVKMEILKNMFAELGFTKVKTLLNSGNVVFQTDKTDVALLTRQIEEEFAKTFGFSVRIMLRTSNEIESLVRADPFKNITLTPQTRFYVTFLADKTSTHLQIPYESERKDLRILQVFQGFVCSMLMLSPNRKTVDLMGIIEKAYGKNVTTRNWNTVLKIQKLMQE